MSSFGGPSHGSHRGSSPHLPPALPAQVGSDPPGSDSSFQPVPTSGRHSSDIPDSYGKMADREKREIVSDACRVDSDYAKSVLAPLPAQLSGWCRLVSLKPTKEGGYVQVSYGGANKFAMLQSVVLWAAGRDITEDGEQASHLCHQPLCKTVGHVVPESAQKNNSRKGCLVWIDCHHCDKKILLCTHAPVCIKYCEGYSSMEDFVQRGDFCRVLRDEA